MGKSRRRRGEHDDTLQLSAGDTAARFKRQVSFHYSGEQVGEIHVDDSGRLGFSGRWGPSAVVLLKWLAGHVRFEGDEAALIEAADAAQGES